MKDLHCQKRRRVVIRSKDGSTQEVYRCANGATKNYRSNVDNSICENCSLCQPLLKLTSTCKEHPPSQPIWPEPHYSEGGDIVYPHQDGIQPPPTPQGYIRKSTKGAESWKFESKWGQCSYRQLMNQRTPKGDLQIHAYCTAQNHCVVKCEECEKCLVDMIKIDGDLNKKNVKNNVPVAEQIRDRLENDGIPNYPGAAELLDNYWKAIRRWVAAGRPKRKDSEVQRIYEEFCTPCDWFDSESQRCKGCGCKVKPKGIALLNKPKMRTEHCPRKFW